MEEVTPLPMSPSGRRQSSPRFTVGPDPYGGPTESDELGLWEVQAELRGAQLMLEAAQRNRQAPRHVANKAHQGSARMAPSMLHQRQRMPGAAPRSVQPRPVSRLGRP